MITGEMFHEYCENESVDPTPRPVPDINKLPKYHYLPVAETSITNTDDGKRREVDDYHPRARLKQVHKKNEINIEDSASVQTFCSKDGNGWMEMLNSGKLAKQRVCALDRIHP